jgi:hypothetical protein
MIRLSAGFVAALACAYALGGCMQAPPQAAPKVASLRVTAEPPETTVYESDHFLGTARLLAKQPKQLKPGVKYLSFKAPGYFPHDMQVDLAPGETSIKIKLRPIPP